MAENKQGGLIGIEKRVREFVRERPDFAYEMLAKPIVNLHFIYKGNGRYDDTCRIMGTDRPGRLSVYGADSKKGQCGWAYKSHSGDVFKFVQEIHELESRADAVAHAAKVLLQVHGLRGTVQEWQQNSTRLFEQSLRARDQLDGPQLQHLTSYFPADSPLLMRVGYDRTEHGYYIEYCQDGKPVAIEWASLNQEVLYYHERKVVWKRDRGWANGTFPCLSQALKAPDHRLIVFTDHAESAAALREQGIEAYGLLRGINRPSLDVLKKLKHRKFVVIGHNASGGRQFRQSLVTYLTNNNLQAEPFYWPDEEFLPTGLTMFTVLQGGGRLEIDHNNCLEMDIPDRFYDMEATEKQYRFHSLKNSFAAIPALIVLAPNSVISGKAKLVYAYLIHKQGRFEQCRVDNHEFTQACDCSISTLRRALKQLTQRGFIEKHGNRRYSAMRRDAFSESDIAKHIFEELEAAKVRRLQTKRGIKPAPGTAHKPKKSASGETGFQNPASGKRSTPVGFGEEQRKAQPVPAPDGP